MKKIWYLGGIGMFVLPLLIIHCLFKIKSGIPFWEATWSSGDLLNYVASFFILSCTVIIAVRQTKIQENQLGLAKIQSEIQKEQIRLEKNQQKVDWMSRAVLFEIIDISGEFNDYNIRIRAKEAVNNIEFKNIKSTSFNASSNILVSGPVELNSFLHKYNASAGEWNLSVKYTKDKDGYSITKGNKVDSTSIVLNYQYNNLSDEVYECEKIMECNWNKDTKKGEIITETTKYINSKKLFGL